MKQRDQRQPLPDPDLQTEQAVGISVDRLAALYVLDGIKGFGPQKFKQLREANITPEEALKDPGRLPIKGKQGDKLRALIEESAEKSLAECRSRAVRQIDASRRYDGKIVTYESPCYPRNVYLSNNPAPILYVRGSLDVLGQQNTVACVGSRKIRPPYAEALSAFVDEASRIHFAIVSGFALGADSIGHTRAFTNRGQTICCMPGGLDRPFPPENKGLWTELLSYKGAAFVSEFAYGTLASTLTLRKRNKLIVAFAKGVMVGQSSTKGGAMNAYRFAIEQKKPVATFAYDEMEDTSGNKQIAANRKMFDAVFAISEGTHKEYREWLSGLSSSI
jgi:DNA processing protein